MRLDRVGERGQTFDDRALVGVGDESALADQARVAVAQGPAGAHAPGTRCVPGMKTSEPGRLECRAVTLAYLAANSVASRSTM